MGSSNEEEGAPPSAAARGRADRAVREAAALRENLLRRKAQARARDAGCADEPVAHEEPPACP